LTHHPEELIHQHLRAVLHFELRLTPHPGMSEVADARERHLVMQIRRRALTSRAPIDGEVLEDQTR